MFLGPPAAAVAGVAGHGAGADGWPQPQAAGLAGWAVMAAVALPAVRAFGLRPAWALTLPLSGTLYGMMTVDSALRGPRGGGWR
jgi:hypothetical protein